MARAASTLTAVLLLAVGSVPAADVHEDLAKQLSNPISSLISVPLQGNFDFHIGPEDDGLRHTLNIQPVAPFSMNKNWNIISRTILPVIYQEDIFPGAGDQFGIGDTVQSLFFSPARPTRRGVIWGAGPVFLLSTGSDDLLTADQYGLGPTGVILTQHGPWTCGALANHIWSITDSNDHPDINSTFIQPFLAYNTKDGWTFTIQSETTIDWEADDLTVPVNGIVSKLVTFGKQPISLGMGLRWWVTTPDSGPEGLGFRYLVTFLFPK